MKLSSGDIVVNEAVENNKNINVAKVTYDEAIENEKRYLKKLETSKDNKKEVVPSNLKEIIIADKSGATGEGTYKYTFDNIYEDKELAKVAKDYYKERDGTVYENNEAIDKFISDRTWKQANTVSIANELSYITGRNAGQDQKARLAYLTKVWGELPNFYESGGRGFEGFYKNLGVALTDPLNLISGGIGGLVGKAVVGTAAKQALKTATKTAIGKKVAEEVTKDIILNPEELAKLSSKVANKKILATAGTISVIDGVGYGLADIAAQTTEKEIGMRQKYDPYRTMLVSLGSAGTSFVAVGGIGYGVQKLRNIKADKQLKNLPSKVEKVIKDNAEFTDEGLKKFNTSGNYLRTRLADQYDFVKVLQKELLGVEGSAAGLKSAATSGKFNVDPVLMPYFQLRMAAAASTRAHEFIAHGVHMPPSAMMRQASFVKGKSLGLHTILKPFDDVSEVPNFLAYVAAKRQKALIKNNPKLKNELPYTVEEMDKMIDYGELSPTQFKQKHKEILNRKGNYQDGAIKLKVFTDELLEYQVKSGLISADDAKKILNLNEFFIPLYRTVKNTTGQNFSLTQGIKNQMSKILRPTRPGAKKLAKTKQEGEINLYDNLISYVYKAINGADRNRAKISLYEMINKAKKLKQLEKNGLIKKTNYVVENRKALGNVIKKRYEDAGVKIIPDSDGNLPNLDVAVFGSTFKKLNGENFVDIVYINGKETAYEILDTNLAQSFISFGDDTMKLFNNVARNIGASWYSRVASRAITYSPPFVAFNAIRDTLAATVNSVFGIVNKKGFGFIPGWTSAKEFIESIRLNDEYRKAMISGIGYSSRADSEKLLSLSNAELQKFGSKTEKGLYKGSLKKITKYLMSGWRGWTEIVSRVEYAARMGEYNLGRAAGLSDVAAGFLGREVSTDFGMRGSNTFLKSLSRNSMFLNASIQGLYRTGRLAFEGTLKDRIRVASTISTTVIAPEIYLYFQNRDIPEYKQLDEKIKQLNYVIPTYSNESGVEKFDGFMFWPKPYDLGAFANLSVALIKGIYEKTPELGFRYALQSINNIVPSIPLPTMFVPGIEIILNKNMYTGSVVLGMYEKQAVERLQYRPQTREIARQLANFLSNVNGATTLNNKEGAEKKFLFNLGPIEIDYLVGAYATGIMQYPLDVINDLFFEKADKGSKLEKIDPFGVKKQGLNIIKPTPTSSSRKFNMKKPWTFVTNRFKSDKTIKNSFYHKEWFRIQKEARKLKVLSLSNLGNSKELNVNLIKKFDNIKTNVDNNEPIQSKEAKEYDALGQTYKGLITMINDFRETRKNIEIMPDVTAEWKKNAINDIYASENAALYSFFTTIAKMDLDFILSDTVNIPGTLGTVDVELKTQNKRGDKE